jgi:PHD/YefM family antitoxin component YafN of YafNO toxin-antitoxin module
MQGSRKPLTITEFNRNTLEHLERLTATKQPELYTHTGKPCVVMQDAEAYKHMAELADYADGLITMRHALSEQGRPLESFTQEFEASVGLSS